MNENILKKFINLRFLNIPNSFIIILLFLLFDNYSRIIIP